MNRKLLIDNNIITKKDMINPHFTRKVKMLDIDAVEWMSQIKYSTRFLDGNSSLKERVYCIINNIDGMPTCNHCGNPTKLQYHRNIKSYRFSSYCCTTCAAQHRDEELILKTRKATNKMLYGNENLMAIPRFRDKQISTTTKHHGGRHPKQTHISTTSYEILHNKASLIEMHHTKKMSMTAMSYILSVDSSTVSKYLSKHNIKKMNFTRSLGEIQICEWLDSINIEYVTNDRTLIGKELDIYIPKYNLAIEYCGLYWHADFNAHITKYYHKDKQQLCANHNIQLLTIFEDEWINKRDIIISKLEYLLTARTNTTIYARKTSVVAINNKQRKLFMNKYHIQGDGPGTITYGLMNENELVACMTFINTKGNYVLNRYATSCHVPGGFLKLLSHFKNHTSWNMITSFADLRWSLGNLYDKTGWVLDKVLPPDYCYVNTNNNSRVHKFNYRHKYLSKRLDVYDPSLSERVNCDINRIPRLWDCGKLRYVINNDKQQMVTNI